MSIRVLPALCLALLLAVPLAACGGGAEGGGNGSPANARAQGPGGPQGRERPAVPVEVAQATRGSIASTYAATATLEAEKQAEILARVSGLVESRQVEEGDRVSAGQVLLTIDNDEYALRLSQARATAANLRGRAERMREMWEQRLVSVEEKEALENELAAAEAAEELAALELGYTRVQAPFSGRITQRLADVGQNISVGTPLFVLADFDPLLARVHVPARQFGDLAAGQAVKLVLDSDRRELQGRIKLVSPTIDPETGTIKLTVEIPGAPARVRPGDFAEVRVVTELREGRLLVPRSAVISEKGEDVVFVVAGEQAERRVVELGLQDDAHAEVLDGIAEGDSIVVKGQRSLEDGAKVRVVQPEA